MTVHDVPTKENDENKERNHDATACYVQHTVYCTTSRPLTAATVRSAVDNSSNCLHSPPRSSPKVNGPPQ